MSEMIGISPFRTGNRAGCGAWGECGAEPGGEWVMLRRKPAGDKRLPLQRICESESYDEETSQRERPWRKLTATPGLPRYCVRDRVIPNWDGGGAAHALVGRKGSHAQGALDDTRQAPS